MKRSLTIVRKELLDALRDRRTLLTALLSSMLAVPLLLLIFSVLLAQMESQDERRSVLVVGIAAAPELENFILRNAYQIVPAPTDYVAKSRSKELDAPVLIIAADFSKKLAAGEKVSLEIAYDSGNRPAQFGARALRRLLTAYAQETTLRLLSLRGVSTELLQMVEIRERNVQAVESRKGSLTEMLPMMVMMAIVISGMVAAIDSTAGERERGSLEPLMMNPLSGTQLALGKWGAVTILSWTVAGLTIASFFPAQWLLRSDTLRAEFQFSAGDAGNFLLILLPLAALVAALQIAIALDCKTYKEAQVRNQLVTILIPLVSLLPLLFPGREPTWFQWLPVLAQNQLMNQVLKGQPPTLAALLAAALVCALLTLLVLYRIARKMRRVVLES